MFGRALGVLGLGVRRVVGRARIAPQRVVLTVLGVGLAVGLMVAVTGVSLGLASQSVVESEGVDYWVVPEGSDVRSVAVSTEGVALGDVHPTAREIRTDSRVDYATPVLLELVPVRDVTTGERTYLLVAGVVASADGDVLGLSAGALTPGDPHYANGSYDGPWTGDVVLSEAAATVTNASTGTGLAVDRSGANRTMTVVNVSQGDVSTGMGSTPVALVHLSELQALGGATAGDQADQILVSTTDQGVRDELAGVYPRTTVVTRSGLAAQQVTGSNLPLAVAVAALVSAVVVGVLLVTTLMGLEVSAGRQHLGTMAAVGVGRRTRSILVAVETLVVAALGGLTGIGLGWLGVLGVNALGSATLGAGVVARFDPVLVGYAVVVSLVIGALGAVYPVVLSRRTTVREVLSR